LQTNSTLAAGNWGTLASSFGIVSNTYAFTNAVGGSRMFYRLKQ
jgi:hypothetical protein